MATKTVEFVPDILDLDGDHSDWIAIGILSDLEGFAGDLRPTGTRDDLHTIQAWLDRAMDAYDKFQAGTIKAAAQA